MEQLPVKEASRSKKDYLKMSHSVLGNHLKTEQRKLRPGHKISDFITKQFWSWVYNYLKSRFGKRFPYQTYDSTDTGIYRLPGNTCIAITADWATDTAESFGIASKIRQHDPDYTIHLGDTYYVGAPHEIASNFLHPQSPWPRGKKGSFALLGNHEMYARGDAYFKYLLKSIGLRTESNKFSGQKASFFCLENEYWRILGLDTGYNSIGKIPVLELLPWFAPDCRFEDAMMDWLRDVVRLGDPADKRGLLILTHHQYVTAFHAESEYSKPATQLASFIGKDRPVLWIWGHEHKLSAFEKIQVNDGITAYGRCIGHGGMPVELDSKSFKLNPGARGYQSLVMVDDRRKQGSDFGFNGYVTVNINGAELCIQYYDDTQKIMCEKWYSDLSGAIQGTINIEPSAGLETNRNRPISDATS